MKTITILLLIQVIVSDSLVQLKTLPTGDSPLLMKILQSVDAATSDEHLFHVTLKLLKSLCLCMRETLKYKEREFNGDSNSIDEDTSDDGKVLDIYKKIYNHTCFNLKRKVASNVRSNNATDEDSFLDHNNCGKHGRHTFQDSAEIRTNKDSLQDTIKSKFKNIISKTLRETKDYHKYRIRRYNLFGKAKPYIKSNSKHSIIVILTLHPLATDIELRNQKHFIEVELNNTLYTNSSIEIDVIDAKYDPKGKESEENPSSEAYSDCNLQSIYVFLIESERKNLTKVFRLLQRQGTFKVYIDVTTDRNHTDYSSLCCKNDTTNPLCEKDFKRYFQTEEDMSINNDKKANSYQKSISKIKKLVKLYTNRLKKVNDPSMEEIFTDNTNKPMYTFVSEEPLKLREVTQALLLLNDVVTKQTTRMNQKMHHPDKSNLKGIYSKESWMNFILNDDVYNEPTSAIKMLRTQRWTTTLPAVMNLTQLDTPNNLSTILLVPVPNEDPKIDKVLAITSAATDAYNNVEDITKAALVEDTKASHNIELTTKAQGNTLPTIYFQTTEDKSQENFNAISYNENENIRFNVSLPNTRGTTPVKENYNLEDNTLPVTSIKMDITSTTKIMTPSLLTSDNIIKHTTTTNNFTSKIENTIKLDATNKTKIVLQPIINNIETYQKITSTQYNKILNTTPLSTKATKGVQKNRLDSSINFAINKMPINKTEFPNYSDILNVSTYNTNQPNSLRDSTQELLHDDKNFAKTNLNLIFFSNIPSNTDSVTENTINVDATNQKHVNISNTVSVVPSIMTTQIQSSSQVSVKRLKYFLLNDTELKNINKLGKESPEKPKTIKISKKRLNFYNETAVQKSTVDKEVISSNMNANIDDRKNMTTKKSAAQAIQNQMYPDNLETVNKTGVSTIFIDLSNDLPSKITLPSKVKDIVRLKFYTDYNTFASAGNKHTFTDDFGTAMNTQILVPTVYTDMTTIKPHTTYQNYEEQSFDADFDITSKLKKNIDRNFMIKEERKDKKDKRSSLQTVNFGKFPGNKIVVYNANNMTKDNDLIAIGNNKNIYKNVFKILALKLPVKDDTLIEATVQTQGNTTSYTFTKQHSVDNSIDHYDHVERDSTKKSEKEVTTQIDVIPRLMPSLKTTSSHNNAIEATTDVANNNFGMNVLSSFKSTLKISGELNNTDLPSTVEPMKTSQATTNYNNSSSALYERYTVTETNISDKVIEDIAHKNENQFKSLQNLSASNRASPLSSQKGNRTQLITNKAENSGIILSTNVSINLYNSTENTTTIKLTKHLLQESTKMNVLTDGRYTINKQRKMSKRRMYKTNFNDSSTKALSISTTDNANQTQDGIDFTAGNLVRYTQATTSSANDRNSTKHDDDTNVLHINHNRFVNLNDTVTFMPKNVDTTQITPILLNNNSISEYSSSIPANISKLRAEAVTIGVNKNIANDNRIVTNAYLHAVTKKHDNFKTFVTNLRTANKRKTTNETTIKPTLKTNRSKDWLIIFKPALNQKPMDIYTTVRNNDDKRLIKGKEFVNNSESTQHGPVKVLNNQSKTLELVTQSKGTTLETEFITKSLGNKPVNQVDQSILPTTAIMKNHRQNVLGTPESGTFEPLAHTYATIVTTSSFIPYTTVSTTIEFNKKRGFAKAPLENESVTKETLFNTALPTIKKKTSLQFKTSFSKNLKHINEALRFFIKNYQNSKKRTTPVSLHSFNKLSDTSETLATVTKKQIDVLTHHLQENMLLNANLLSQELITTSDSQELATLDSTTKIPEAATHASIENTEPINKTSVNVNTYHVTQIPITTSKEQDVATLEMKTEPMVTTTNILINNIESTIKNTMNTNHVTKLARTSKHQVLTLSKTNLTQMNVTLHPSTKNNATIKDKTKSYLGKQNLVADRKKKVSTQLEMKMQVKDALAYPSKEDMQPTIKSTINTNQVTLEGTTTSENQDSATIKMKIEQTKIVTHPSIENTETAIKKTIKTKFGTQKLPNTSKSQDVAESEIKTQRMEEVTHPLKQKVESAITNTMKTNHLSHKLTTSTENQDLITQAVASRNSPKENMKSATTNTIHSTFITKELSTPNTNQDLSTLDTVNQKLVGALIYPTSDNLDNIIIDATNTDLMRKELTTPYINQDMTTIKTRPATNLHVYLLTPFTEVNVINGDKTMTDKKETDVISSKIIESTLGMQNKHVLPMPEEKNIHKKSLVDATNTDLKRKELSTPHINQDMIMIKNRPTTNLHVHLLTPFTEVNIIHGDKNMTDKKETDVISSKIIESTVGMQNKNVLPMPEEKKLHKKSLVDLPFTTDDSTVLARLKTSAAKGTTDHKSLKTADPTSNDINKKVTLNTTITPIEKSIVAQLQNFFLINNNIEDQSERNTVLSNQPKRYIDADNLNGSPKALIATDDNKLIKHGFKAQIPSNLEVVLTVPNLSEKNPGMFMEPIQKITTNNNVVDMNIKKGQYNLSVKEIPRERDKNNSMPIQDRLLLTTEENNSAANNPMTKLPFKIQLNPESVSTPKLNGSEFLEPEIKTLNQSNTSIQIENQKSIHLDRLNNTTTNSNLKLPHTNFLKSKFKIKNEQRSLESDKWNKINSKINKAQSTPPKSVISSFTTDTVSKLAYEIKLKTELPTVKLSEPEITKPFNSEWINNNKISGLNRLTSPSDGKHNDVTHTVKKISYKDMLNTEMEVKNQFSNSYVTTEKNEHHNTTIKNKTLSTGEMNDIASSSVTNAIFKTKLNVKVPISKVIRSPGQNATYFTNSVMFNQYAVKTIKPIRTTTTMISDFELEEMNKNVTLLFSQGMYNTTQTILDINHDGLSTRSPNTTISHKIESNSEMSERATLIYKLVKNNLTTLANTSELANQFEYDIQDKHTNMTNGIVENIRAITLLNSAKNIIPAIQSFKLFSNKTISHDKLYSDDLKLNPKMLSAASLYENQQNNIKEQATTQINYKVTVFDPTTFTDLTNNNMISRLNIHNNTNSMDTANRLPNTNTLDAFESKTGLRNPLKTNPNSKLAIYNKNISIDSNNLQQHLKVTSEYNIQNLSVKNKDLSQKNDAIELTTEVLLYATPTYRTPTTLNTEISHQSALQFTTLGSTKDREVQTLNTKAPAQTHFFKTNSERPESMAVLYQSIMETQKVNSTFTQDSNTATERQTILLSSKYPNLSIKADALTKEEIIIENNKTVPLVPESKISSIFTEENNELNLNKTLTISFSNISMFNINSKHSTSKTLIKGTEISQITKKLPNHEVTIHPNGSIKIKPSAHELQIVKPPQKLKLKIKPRPVVRKRKPKKPKNKKTIRKSKTNKPKSKSKKAKSKLSTTSTTKLLQITLTTRFPTAVTIQAQKLPEIFSRDNLTSLPIPINNKDNQMSPSNVLLEQTTHAMKQVTNTTQSESNLKANDWKHITKAVQESNDYHSNMAIFPGVTSKMYAIGRNNLVKPEINEDDANLNMTIKVNNITTSVPTTTADRTFINNGFKTGIEFTINMQKKQEDSNYMKFTNTITVTPGNIFIKYSNETKANQMDNTSIPVIHKKIKAHKKRMRKHKQHRKMQKSTSTTITNSLSENSTNTYENLHQITSTSLYTKTSVENANSYTLTNNTGFGSNILSRIPPISTPVKTDKKESINKVTKLLFNEENITKSFLYTDKVKLNTIYGNKTVDEVTNKMSNNITKRIQSKSKSKTIGESYILINNNTTLKYKSETNLQNIGIHSTDVFSKSSKTDYPIITANNTKGFDLARTSPAAVILPILRETKTNPQHINYTSNKSSNIIMKIFMHETTPSSAAGHEVVNSEDFKTPFISNVNEKQKPNTHYTSHKKLMKEWPDITIQGTSIESSQSDGEETLQKYEENITMFDTIKRLMYGSILPAEKQINLEITTAYVSDHVTKAEMLNVNAKGKSVNETKEIDFQKNIEIDDSTKRNMDSSNNFERNIAIENLELNYTTEAFLLLINDFSKGNKTMNLPDPKVLSTRSKILTGQNITLQSSLHLINKYLNTTVQNTTGEAKPLETVINDNTETFDNSLETYPKTASGSHHTYSITHKDYSKDIQTLTFPLFSINDYFSDALFITSSTEEPNTENSTKPETKEINNGQSSEITNTLINYKVSNAADFRNLYGNKKLRATIPIGYTKLIKPVPTLSKMREIFTPDIGKSDVMHSKIKAMVTRFFDSFKKGKQANVIKTTTRTSNYTATDRKSILPLLNDYKILSSNAETETIKSLIDRQLIKHDRSKHEVYINNGESKKMYSKDGNVYKAGYNRFKETVKTYAVTRNIRYNTYQPTTKEDLDLLYRREVPVFNTFLYRKVEQRPRNQQPLGNVTSCSALRNLSHLYEDIKDFKAMLKAANCLDDVDPKYHLRGQTKNVHSVRIKNFKSLPLKKGPYFDSFEKTNLLPVKLIQSKPQRKLMKRVQLANKKKEIMTMNTKDFFSQQRFMTQKNVVRDIPKPHQRPIIYRPITSIPRHMVLRPKFRHINNGFPVLEPKHSIMRNDDSTEEMLGHHHMNIFSRKKKVLGPRPIPRVVTPMAPRINILDRPFVFPRASPRLLRDRIDSVRRGTYLYNREYTVTTERFSIHDLFKDKPILDGLEDAPVRIRYRNEKKHQELPATVGAIVTKPRRRRTIFFLSPTVPYNDHFF